MKNFFSSTIIIFSYKKKNINNNTKRTITLSFKYLNDISRIVSKVKQFSYLPLDIINKFIYLLFSKFSEIYYYYYLIKACRIPCKPKKCIGKNVKLQ